MTNEESIKWLKGMKEGLFPFSGEVMNEICDKAIEALSENKGKWIPVSERLPEIVKDGLSEWVLVTIKGVDKTVTMYDRICHGEWLTECFDGEKVLAWQPLPEPYKAESEG